jgi:acetyl esterase/lipase
MRLWAEEFEPLRAEARSIVAAGLGTMARPEVGVPPDQLARAQVAREYMAATVMPVPEAVDETIAGVRCRVFRPERADAPRALYVHFHGGGMIGGLPEMNDQGNLALCRRHGIPVVSVDYRLAPEHPFPAGPDDGIAVVTWLLEHAGKSVADGGFGTDRFLVGGESAGGYMAAAVLLRIRDELGAVDRVLGANLVFGVHDWGRSPSQRGFRPHGGPDMLDPEGIKFFSDCYLPGRTDEERRDPQVSPAFADLRGLPPAMMSVGSSDHLLDDTLLLSGRWAAANGEVELFVGPDLPHGFMAFPCALTQRWERQNDAWFRRILAG